MCFSICERQSLLVREILLWSRGEQIIGGYPKTITFLNIPGIKFSGKVQRLFH